MEYSDAGSFLGTLVMFAAAVGAQEVHRHQDDFPPEEFKERRGRVFEAIGDEAMALIQGAPNIRGFLKFRQTNTFYYLSGVEVPHAYLLLDGRSDSTTLYLPHRNPRRERGEGKVLPAEDADLVKELTGVDRVLPLERMGRDFMGPLQASSVARALHHAEPCRGRRAKPRRDAHRLGCGDCRSVGWAPFPRRTVVGVAARALPAVRDQRSNADSRRSADRQERA